MPSSSVNGTSNCIPTSPSLLLAPGSVGGSVDGLTVDNVFEEGELVTGVSGVAAFTVLSDCWTVESAAVSEMIVVESYDAFTKVPVTRVGLKVLLEVIPTIDVVVAGVSINEKVSNDKTPVTLENDTRLLRLFTLEGDEVIAFAEERAETVEGEP